MQVSMSAIKSLIVHMGSLKEGRKALILVSEGYTNMVPPQMRDAGRADARSRQPQRAQPDGRRQRHQRRSRGVVARHGHGIRSARGLRHRQPEQRRDLRGRSARAGRRSSSTSTKASACRPTRSTSTSHDGHAAAAGRNRPTAARSSTATISTAGMKQIMRDASAYYLIGYNSTQAPSDGKFHEIKVRVKRPGVQVRARKGYWALNRRKPRARWRRRSRRRPRRSTRRSRPSIVLRRAAVVRTWIGTSRGENGKTRVTFVWEPLPQVPGDDSRARARSRRGGQTIDRRRRPMARRSFRRGRRRAARGRQRASTPARQDAAADVGRRRASQVLDTEIREITVPDLTSPQTILGTPEMFRARGRRASSSS